MDMYRECWNRFKKDIQDGEMIRHRRWILEDMARIEKQAKDEREVTFYTGLDDRKFHIKQSCPLAVGLQIKVKTKEMYGKKACSCVKGEGNAVHNSPKTDTHNSK
jgi:hypothetical protein